MVLMIAKLVPVGPFAVCALICCTTSSPQTQAVQRVCVVDESGRAVADARVRLLPNAWSVRVLRTATTGDDGVALFENLPNGRYVLDVAAPPRWNVGWNELEGRSALLRGDTVTVTVQELQLVGVCLPGGRLISTREGSWNYHDPARAEIGKEWRRWPSDAAVLLGFRSPRGPSDAMQMELQAEWFGYEPHIQSLPWTPASRFAGPVVIDRSVLEQIPWCELPVVLRDPDGQPLLPATLRAVRRQCVVFRRDDVEFGRWYRLEPISDRNDRVAVSCGDYTLRWNNAGPWREVDLQIQEDAKAIDCRLPIRLRLLRLQLKGAVGTNWGVQARGAGHFSGRGFPTGSRIVEIPLPIGESELVYENYHDGNRYERKTLRIVIEDADVQVVEWDVG